MAPGRGALVALQIRLLMVGFERGHSKEEAAEHKASPVCEPRTPRPRRRAQAACAAEPERTNIRISRQRAEARACSLGSCCACTVHQNRGAYPTGPDRNASMLKLAI